MRIGVPKECKIHEYRVGLVPSGVRELVDAGHSVMIETGPESATGSAGYRLRQGRRCPDRHPAEEVFAGAD